VSNNRREKCYLNFTKFHYAALCESFVALYERSAFVALAQRPGCARCKEAIISYFAMKCVTILEILFFLFKIHML